MTFGSLFSGIGGFDLGLERAGFTVKWQCEIDEFCNRVLVKHWPNVARFRDVRECGAGNLEPVDLICGGFPCQPFSLAGQRRGTTDDRYLWPEMHRIIAELQPRWVLAENVPSIVNLALDTVYTDLEAEGYEVGTVVIPACAVDAPHIRQRVWIVAHAAGDLWRTSRDDGSTAFDRGSPDVPNPDLARLEERESVNRDDEQKRKAIERTDWWSVEPGICRVFDGLRNRMDGGGVDGKLDRKKASAEARQGTCLRGVRDDGKVTETSPRSIQTTGCGNTLPSMPCQSRSEGWDSQKEEDGDLCNMRGGIPTEGFTCTQDMRTFVPERIGPPIGLQALAWLAEPDIPRIASGVAHRGARLRALGNAVVPQVVEVLGRMIVTVEGY